LGAVWKDIDVLAEIPVVAEMILVGEMQKAIMWLFFLSLI